MILVLKNNHTTTTIGKVGSTVKIAFNTIIITYKQAIPFDLPCVVKKHKIFKEVNTPDPTHKSIGANILKNSCIALKRERPRDKTWKHIQGINIMKSF